MRYIYLLSLAYLFLKCLVLAQEDPKTAKPNVEEKSIRAHIAQLGDAAFDVREMAQKRLAAIVEPALSPLQRAFKETMDAEARDRLGQLIQAIYSTFFVEVRRFERPGDRNKNWSTRLVVTADGRYVVAVRFGSLRCWNVADGQRRHCFRLARCKNLLGPYSVGGQSTAHCR